MALPFLKEVELKRAAGWSVAAFVLSTSGAPATAADARAASTSLERGYPIKPMRIIVTSTPGSGPDIIARLIGQKLMEAWGQQVVVDNRAGASGAIGAEIASRSAPDGYTLMIATAQHAITAGLFEKLNYDLIKDFSPVSHMASTPFILVVNPSVPAATVRELVALANSRPGKLHYGSGGSGSPPHLAAEMFKSMTGIEILHVPYKGVTPALTDTVGGQVQMTFSVIPACLPLVRAGKVRAVGVTSPKRTPLVPDLPTISESVPGYEFIGWYGLVAPARTPREIISKLNGEVVKILKTPEFQEKITGLGAEPVGSTPEELASFMRVELAKMRKAVKASGARPD